MLCTVLRSLSRRTGAAILTIAATAGFAAAQDAIAAGGPEKPGNPQLQADPVPAPTTPKSPFAVTMSLDAQSHYISYGLDTWGAGGKASPASSDATVTHTATVTMTVADNLSVFLNVWGDVNNNADQTLGGNIQEIDVNTGITYTWDKLVFTLAHGFWDYAGDDERLLDFTVAFTDGDLITQSQDISLNPSILFHWRYDGNGAQDDGLAVVPGIRPSFTFLKDEKYPITLAIPVNFAIFTGNFQGGDSGFGFFSAGAVVSVPLAFIDSAKYGTWTASAGATYWHTPDDAIPANPEENFIATFVSIGLAF